MDNYSKKYSRLNYKKRSQIEYLLSKGYSIRHIARELNVAPSTISREIKRNKTNTNTYNSEFAQEIAVKRHKDSRKLGFELYDELKVYSQLFLENFDNKCHGVGATHHLIIDQLMPDAKKLPCLKTIYNWIDSGKWVIVRSECLRPKYNRPGIKRKNANIEYLCNKKYVLPIRFRPKEADERLKTGHWEVDTMQSSRRTGKHLLITLVDRKSRVGFATKVEKKCPFKTIGRLLGLIKENELEVKTITCDNGIEFKTMGILARWLKIKVYRCDAYASHQRGTGENFNGMIRRFLPKGFDFTNLSLEELQAIVDKINNMPRKILGWKSANEVYKKEKKK